VRDETYRCRPPIPLNDGVLAHLLYWMSPGYCTVASDCTVATVLELYAVKLDSLATDSLDSLVLS
jgi:hypothetical protein